VAYDKNGTIATTASGIHMNLGMDDQE